MARIDVAIQFDPEIKKEAENLFDNLGLSFNSGIDLLLRQAIKEGRIPIGSSTNSQYPDKTPDINELDTYRLLFKQIEK